MKRCVRFRCFSRSWVLLLSAIAADHQCPPLPGRNAARTTTPAPDKKRIGFVMKTLTNPFFVEMERCSSSGKALNIELLVKTAAQKLPLSSRSRLSKI